MSTINISEGGFAAVSIASMESKYPCQNASRCKPVWQSSGCSAPSCIVVKYDIYMNKEQEFFLKEIMMYKHHICISMLIPMWCLPDHARSCGSPLSTLSSSMWLPLWVGASADSWFLIIDDIHNRSTKLNPTQNGSAKIGICIDCNSCISVLTWVRLARSSK